MDYISEMNLAVKSGVKLVQLVSFEWQRVYGIVNKSAKMLGYRCFIWSSIEGLKEWDLKSNAFIMKDSQLTDAMDVLNYFKDAKEKMYLVLNDFHPYLKEENHRLIRLIKECINTDIEKVIVFCQSSKAIPNDLTKEIFLLNIKLPNIQILNIVVEKVLQEMPKGFKSDITDKLLSSALGLTIIEAEKAFRKACIKENQLTEEQIPMIIAEKESIIERNGILEYYHPEENMDSIGGLDELKKWITVRGEAFSQDAIDFGINMPKGLLLLGIPGCGKSLTAKAISRTWKFPLLRFDLGKVYGSYVGESEKNIRNAIDVAEAIAPCVLWLDEIEKGLSGSASSGMSDGGTSSRVFGTFLTWMQEKKDPVFVVATANDISKLPPELLRKGRFDEIFFVDLPSEKERQEIFNIHLKRKNLHLENYDVKKFAKHSLGYSGAEIEEIVNDALFEAFYEKRKMEDKDILQSIKNIYPLSRTMRENIINLRKWAQVRARIASNDKPEDLTYQTEDLPILTQEKHNPFVE